jgi:hypothetical protein
MIGALVKNRALDYAEIKHTSKRIRNRDGKVIREVRGINESGYESFGIAKRYLTGNRVNIQ